MKLHSRDNYNFPNIFVNFITMYYKLALKMSLILHYRNQETPDLLLLTWGWGQRNFLGRARCNEPRLEVLKSSSDFNTFFSIDPKNDQKFRLLHQRRFNFFLLFFKSRSETSSTFSTKQTLKSGLDGVYSIFEHLVLNLGSTGKKQANFALQQQYHDNVCHITSHVHSDSFTLVFPWKKV